MDNHKSLQDPPHKRSSETKDSQQREEEKEELKEGKNYSIQSHPLPALPNRSNFDAGHNAARGTYLDVSSGVDMESSHDGEQKNMNLPDENDALGRSVMKEVEAAVQVQNELEETRNHCRILQKQVVELKQNLDDAQNFIFSLQPRRPKLTEKDAIDEFKSLCASVEDFVNRRLFDALYDKLLIRHGRFLIDPARDLLDLIPFSGKEAFKRPSTDDYNVIAMILQFLMNEVFDKKFNVYVGTVEVATFVKSIEKSMRNIEPRRDLITWRTWRSETYSAIANRNEFPQIVQQRKDSLTSKLTEMLNVLLAQTADRAFLSAVYNSIIDPAFSLAFKMHLSVDKFSIEHSLYHCQPPEQPKHLAAELDNFELVDLIGGGKKAQPSANVEYIFDMTPQLVFESVKADSYADQKILKKPKLLVAVTKEGQRPPTETAVSAGLDPTVLGWLDRKVRSHMEKKDRGGVGRYLMGR